MTTQHTPSPWTQGANVRDVKAPALMTVRDANDKVIAFVADTDHMQLIAAAPDLLDSLQKMIAKFDSEMRSEYEGTSMLKGRLAEANHARAAVAKATGEKK